MIIDYLKETETWHLPLKLSPSPRLTQWSCATRWRRWSSTSSSSLLPWWWCAGRLCFLVGIPAAQSCPPSTEACWRWPSALCWRSFCSTTRTGKDWGQHGFSYTIQCLVRNNWFVWKMLYPKISERLRQTIDGHMHMGKQTRSSERFQRQDTHDSAFRVYPLPYSTLCCCCLNSKWRKWLFFSQPSTHITPSFFFFYILEDLLKMKYRII